MGKAQKNKGQLVFKGWPKVTRLFNKRKNITGYRVKARYLTPLRAKFADLIAGLFLILAAIQLAAFMAGEAWVHLFVMAAAFGLFGYGTFRGFRWFVAKLVLIEIWPDVIRVAGLIRFDEYDRTLQHQFDLVEHDKALDENMKLQENKTMWRYYMDCSWVVLRHPSGSLRIAAVYPKQRAERLLERLQAIDMAGPQEQDMAEERSSGAPHTGARPDPA